jgi:DNA processing protein
MVLYVLGNEDALRRECTVAVVGTRTPTDVGIKVTGRISEFFAMAGCLVVSGLAKGIDRAAHVATLRAKGETAAVLGTSLDTIYPAENRPLAEQILASGGVMLSELPLGSPSSKGAFVRRDRIQSGLSLAVIAVQTDVSGGTMHTINFAEKQNRLIFCPAPVLSEAHAPQYRGILGLIDSQRATAFGATDLPRILH